jgi:2-polyprenyl-3-methyl-5-hydroxy-6-metoxy-1,4-benzoquinol methylase/uncharacterized protein YbaR (Trm112 family)
MNKKNSKFVLCTKCNGDLTLDILDETNEINEGFLRCEVCHLQFPIISKIPIFIQNFTQFLENRPSLGGDLLKLASTKKMKDFIKITLTKIKKTDNDLTYVDKRWANIYIKNKNSSFYKNIKSNLSKITSKKFVLEYGSSVGIISNDLGLKHQNVFGVDMSFHALLLAKEQSNKNCDYFLADILKHPFGNKKFDLIIALNILELVEPSLLVGILSSQISNGIIFLSDPYDYERGGKSVKSPLYENQLRQILIHNGFNITKNTLLPSKIIWNLKINERTKLQYKVDLIIGKKHLFNRN